MFPSQGGARRVRAFTLIELVTVISIVTILALLVTAGLDQVRSRVAKVSCMNNLRQLYGAGVGYIQDVGHWPQVDPALLKDQNHAYDNAWILDLMPYGADRPVWICPIIERQLGGPDFKQPQSYRADYMAMPFDNLPRTPFMWQKAPWFVERGDVHGNGNLIIRTSGAIDELGKSVAGTIN